jgi:hypothetical protein
VAKSKLDVLEARSKEWHSGVRICLNFDEALGEYHVYERRPDNGADVRNLDRFKETDIGIVAHKLCSPDSGVK